MKYIEQAILVEVAVVLYKVVQTFKSVLKTLPGSMLSCGTVCLTVQCRSKSGSI